MSVDGPEEIWGIDSGTPRSTALVGQPHGADQRSPTRRRGRDELGIDRVQHQLGSSEHLKDTLLDSSPREVEEPIAPLAVHRRPPEVKATVVACDYVNIELPPCGGGAAGDQVTWLPPDLYAHVDAVERGAVLIAEPPTRKLEPFDSDAHPAKPPTSGPESTRPFGWVPTTREGACLA